MHGTAGLDENAVGQDDHCRVFFGRQRGCFDKQPALLVARCKSLHNAIHKEGAAPSSTDRRLAFELAICHITSNGTRSRFEVDRRTVPDYRLSHQARIEKVRRGIATSNQSGTVTGHGRGNDAGPGHTTRREIGQEGFVRKRVRTEYIEETSF